MESNQTELAGEEPANKGGNMRQRAVTGVVYCLILAVFLALKLFVHDLFFDGLVLLFAICGTYEMLRAFGDKMHISQKVVVMLFSVAVVVVYAVVDFVYTDIFNVQFPDGDPMQAMGRNYSVHITLVVFMTGFAVLMGLLVFAHSKVTLESTGYALMSYLYPTVFLVVLTVCNHLQMPSDMVHTDYSMAALLFVFVISPFTDTFALLVGKSLGKKFPAKMAPNVSPKKTIIGGFGGLIGGAIGAVAVFLLYAVCRSVTGTVLEGFGFTWYGFEWNELVFFLAIGVLASAFSQFGDLVESAIKRKLGIKDMGNLLPGHGGILDRIDSSLYASLVVALVFVVRLMTAG